MGKRSREQLSGGERHEAGSDAAGRVQITVRLAAWLEERRAWYWSLLKAANAPPPSAFACLLLSIQRHGTLEAAPARLC